MPKEFALQGFDGVRAYAHDPEQSRALPRGDARVRAAAAKRAGRRAASSAAASTSTTRATRVGVPGAGTVHHVAWASPTDEHEAWQRRVAESGAHPTPVIDRYYFKSIYFREPSGVLFEIATIGPGFTADEPLEIARRAPLAAARTTSTCATGSSAC
mgnify:CR=1 FL=1